MLMAVVVFFIIAGLFFVIVQYRQMYKEAGLLEKEKTFSTIAKIADTAEFTCGKPLCIDTDKLIVMQERAAYEGFWPVTSLSVRKVFPKQEETLCNKDNYPDCNVFNVYDKGVENEERVATFVSLCRKEREGEYWHDYPGKCELGKIIAGFEIKQPD